MNVRPYLEWRPAIGRNVWIDPAAIAIGAHTSIQDGSVLHVASARLAGGTGIPLLIGDDCTVGHGVILHACTVGNRCLIGIGAIVMDGAVIGDEVIVGAGALVPAARVRRDGDRLPGGIVRALRHPERRLPASTAG